MRLILDAWTYLISLFLSLLPSPLQCYAEAVSRVKAPFTFPLLDFLRKGTLLILFLLALWLARVCARRSQGAKREAGRTDGGKADGVKTD